MVLLETAGGMEVDKIGTYVNAINLWIRGYPYLRRRILRMIFADRPCIFEPGYLSRVVGHLNVKQLNGWTGASFHPRIKYISWIRYK